MAAKKWIQDKGIKQMNLKVFPIKQTLQRMKMTQKKPWLIIGLITLITLLVSIKLIEKPNDPAKSKQLSTQAVIDENTLNTVHLNDDSYRKLGIEIATIKRENIIERKIYGGDIMVPAGGLVSVIAPITGKLIALEKNLLKLGSPIKAGQLLYRIEPIITPDARVNLVNALADAENLVNVTKSQVEATTIALNRTKKLLQDLVGSQRNVDEANTAHEIALKNLEAAHIKKNALHQVVNLGTLEPIEINAPQAGIVSNIFAVTDQLVSIGNPIIEISNLETLWIRVPVPTEDLNSIDQLAEAKVEPSSAASNLMAAPINAPLTADPLTNSSHLYYIVENANFALHPAQRVSVLLKTQSKATSALTLPWSAVVIDIYGGNWIYTQQSKNSYERQRVFLDHVNGNQAVISEGPPEGSKIVANGALELFGVETGFRH